MAQIFEIDDSVEDSVANADVSPQQYEPIDLHIVRSSSADDCILLTVDELKPEFVLESYTNCGKRIHDPSVEAELYRFASSKCENYMCSTVCVVCLETDVGAVSIPCRHMVTCAACSALCNNCPMCREFIGVRIVIGQNC